jgi:hypothetical protein
MTGRISKIGDAGVPTALYEAANVILTRTLKARESGVCEEYGYQTARRKACILLVSCRSVTNFA